MKSHMYTGLYRANHEYFLHINITAYLFSKLYIYLGLKIWKQYSHPSLLSTASINPPNQDTQILKLPIYITKKIISAF